MASNMKKDYDLGLEKSGRPTRLKCDDDKKNRLTKALRDNLKKRKVQASTRKISKKLLDSVELNKE
jgi:hypothetical protein